TSARCIPGANVPITIASRSATSAWARRLLTWRDGRAVVVEAIYALKRGRDDLATVDSRTVGPVLSSAAPAPQPSVADSEVPEESKLPLHQRVVCSTISFRRHPLDQALSLIGELGFAAIDLGALPGVCDHVPYELNSAAVSEVAGTIRRSG